MTTIPVFGNLAADVELKRTPKGTAVATFRLLENRRSNAGEDLPPNAFTVRVWGEQAENVASSIGRGSRVTVIGHIETETWKDKATGEPRSRQILEAHEVGASMRWATVTVTRNPGTPDSDRHQHIPAPDGWRERA